MKATDYIMGMLEEFLNKKLEPLQFSFEFPSALVSSYEKLESENKQLAELLDEELPYICANYEPDDVARKGEKDLLNTDQFYNKIKQEYERARELLK